MLFLSVIDKAQVILFSAGADGQPYSVNFGGLFGLLSCYTTPTDTCSLNICMNYQNQIISGGNHAT